MPVGTGGTVKAMYMDQVRDLGADIILGNTYHLMLRPGAERVARLGGLHRFSGWDGPDPDRFRRVSGDVAVGSAEDHGAGA
jgi:queuine tRNA-ribosyltransferase